MNQFQIELETSLQCTPIVYIPHFDYEMIDREIVKALNRNGLGEECIAEYDINRGIVDFDSKRKKKGNEYAAYDQLDVWLECIVDAEDTDIERIFLFKNLQQEALDNFRIQLLLQTFAAKYKRGDYKNKGSVYSIVIVSPMAVSALSANIENVFTMLEYRHPSAEEIMARISELPIADSVLRRGQTEVQFREELTYKLLGLHMYEVEQILRTIMVFSYNGKLNNKSIQYALQEKQRIVKKSGIIEVVETDVSFEEVGGLEKLKEDLSKKALLYRNLNEIRNKHGFNLPIPKGVLIIGMPGCGKTMIAKAVAKKFGVSLLRLDVNRLMGQYVGMSEENLRRALQTAETAHPCVLWIDEVEKAFAGAGAGGENDMLVQRLMGQFLTWMQERKTAVYIVATANDVMRPEFMRKGRFDDVYFVDFPNLEERKSILKAKMRRYGFLENDLQGMFDFSDFTYDGKDNVKFVNIAQMMRADKDKENKVYGEFSTGFSGAEIESVVNQVMENAYIRYRESVEAKKPISLPIKVTEKDFDFVVDMMRPSIMANQIVTEKDRNNNPNKTTNIERIREMEKIYKFTRATR